MEDSTKIILSIIFLIIIIIIIISTFYFRNRLLMQTGAVTAAVYGIVFLTHFSLSDENRNHHTILSIIEFMLPVLSITFLIYVIWGELVKEHPIRSYDKMSAIVAGFLTTILIYNLTVIKIYSSQTN